MVQRNTAERIQGRLSRTQGLAKLSFSVRFCTVDACSVVILTLASLYYDLNTLRSNTDFVARIKCVLRFDKNYYRACVNGTKSYETSSFRHAGPCPPSANGHALRMSSGQGVSACWQPEILVAG